MTYEEEPRMPFGMHKGVKIGDVPASYLLWLYEEWQHDEDQLDRYPQIVKYIEGNLHILTKEALAEYGAK